MTDSAYQTLARQFLDLWQKQLSAVVSDRDFIQSMLDLTQSMQAGVGESLKQAYGYEQQSKTGGPAVSPGAESGRLDELEYRLRMLEARVERLEQSVAQPKRAGSAGKRPAKRSPRKGG